MKIFKSGMVSFVLMTVAMQSNAQQDPQFTQYMYNTIHVNPGYAGSREALTVSALHRSQWTGIDGAPMTQTFFLHAPVSKDRIGLGLSMLHDRIGPIRQTFIYADFAYRIRISSKINLGMGLKGGVNLFQPRLNTVETVETNDPLYVNSDLAVTTAPNFGFGLYLHHEKWYIGASAPRLIESKMKTGKDNNNVVLEKRHFFLIGGLVLPAGNSVKIKPTVQAKIVGYAPVSLDGSLEALFLDRFSFGIAYRWDDAISGLAGVYITPQLRLGIAYDYTLSELQNHNTGSYEAMLQYDFIYKNKRMVKSPRYF